MNQQTWITAEGLARITTPPEFKRTPGGLALCRFKVATETGPASRPVVKMVYVKGDPALAPSEDLPVKIKNKLGVGTLVRVKGTECQRQRKVRGVEFTEDVIVADEVGLRAYAQVGRAA